MPDPSEYENEKEWMAACVPKRIEEGDEQDQAVAVCMGMWREKKSLDTVVAYGQAVKALGDGRVGGYLVRFSTSDDPDISPERDYFTVETDYMVMFPSKSPAWWNHNLDNKKARLSHDAELRQDEFGIWAETILDERDQYEKFLHDLAKKGKLGWSSGTAAHLVEREMIGAAHYVKRWPLGLDASLTHIPAEPRNTVIPLKSLSEAFTPIPEQIPGDEPQADETAASEGHEQEGKKSLSDLPKEVTAMEENKETPTVIQLTKEELADLMNQSAQKALKELPAKQEAKAVAQISITEDESERPFKSAGEFFKAVAQVKSHGEDVRLKSLKGEDGYAVRAYKAQPTGVGEEIPSRGGFLVDQPTQPGLLERMYQDGEVLNRVSWIDVGPNANGIVLNAADETSRADGSRWGGVRGYWVAEAGSITASYPTFRKMNLRLNKVAALCYATDELISDASALESWIMRTVPAELRFKVEDAIINGDGMGKPKGVLNDSGIYVAITAETSQAAATLLYENVLKMWAQCWAPSRRNAVWYINQDIEPQLHAMSLAIGTAGVPVYLPAGGASGQPYGTLFGRPVVPIEYCATLGTVGDIILADMSQYQAIRKGGVQSATSIHVNFTSDELIYRFIYRADGQPLWSAYLTPYKGTAYKSPFLAVATRS